MLAIRLARVGAKKKPAYRVVVIERSRARNSSSVEIVGHYNPTKDPIALSLERDRIDYWIGKGARPSKTVERLMKYEPPEPSEVTETPATDKKAPVADSKVAEEKPPEPPAAEQSAASEAPAEESKPAAEATESKAVESAAEPTAEEPASEEAAKEEPAPGAKSE